MQYTAPSQYLIRQSGRDVHAIQLDSADVANYRALENFGVRLSNDDIRMMHEIAISAQRKWGGMATDAMTPLITNPTIPVPVQFLQNWLAGQTYVVTAATNADLILGRAIVANFEDAEVVNTTLEPLGGAISYSDYGHTPLSSWNPEFEARSIYRGELGLRVGILEEMRAAKIRINSGQVKRTAVGNALNILRNYIAFYGYNNGANRTFGLFNDPKLPSYVPVPNGVSGSPLWADKTYFEIIADILTWLTALRVNSKDRINPKREPITIALATACIDRLSTPNSIGGATVWDWLAKNYSNVRVVSAPELNGAASGDNAAYCFADSVPDSGTDDQATWIQPVPTVFMSLGVQKLIKGYEEDYGMATAGAFLKRPYAVNRASGM